MSLFRQSFFEKNNLFYWLAFGLVLVPLLVVPNGYYPHIYYKSLVIIGLSLIIVASWLVKFFFSGGIKKIISNLFNYKNLQESVRENYLLFIVFLWLGWTTIASAIGENWQRSWYGDWERSEGLMLLWSLFFATIILVKTIDLLNWNRLIKSSLNVSAIISILSFVQLLGLNIMILPDADRASSTIGNAAFFATYALIHAGLALAVTFDHKSKAKNKYWYLLIAILNVGGVLASGTRGAFLGLLAGGLLVIIFSILWKDFFGRFSNKLKYSLSALVLVVLIIIGLRVGGVIKTFPSQIERAINITANSVTAQTRLEMWKYGWQGALASPFFGYGFENYQYVFEKYVQPNYFRLADSEVWNTRAHNVLFDRLSDGGFGALISYLIIFIGLFIKVIKAKKDKGSKYSIFLLATIFGYFVQNLFLFDSVTSYIFFFLIIGLVAAEDRSDWKLDFDNKIKTRVAYGLVLVVILLLGFCINRQWQLGTELLSAVKAQEKFDVKTADSLYLDIKSKTNRDGQAEKVLVNSLSKTVSARGLEKFNKDDLKQYLSDIISGMENYLQHDPKSVQIRFHYSRALIMYYQIDENEETMNKLSEALKIDHELSPNNIQVIWAQTVAMIQKNDLESAINFCNQGIKLLPENPTGYWYLSLIYFEQKKDDLAYENAGKAIDLGYAVKLFEGWNKLYDHYYNLNDYPKMEKLLYAYLAENKNDVDGYFALVDVLKQEKKFDLARQTVKKIMTFSPATTDLVYQEIERINYLEKYGKESTSTDETIFENVPLPIN